MQELRVFQQLGIGEVEKRLQAGIAQDRDRFGDQLVREYERMLALDDSGQETTPEGAAPRMDADGNIRVEDDLNQIGLKLGRVVRWASSTIDSSSPAPAAG